MTILERYLWRSILLSILLTWLSLSLLFALFDFLAELADLDSDTRYGALQALGYVFLGLPRTLYMNFPYAVLIGSLLGLGNLAANSEIVAMRAAGFSINRIVGATLKLGIGLSLMVFALGEWGVPRAESYAQHYKTRLEQQEVALSAEGAWLKNNNRLVHIEKVWSEIKLDGIAVYEIDHELGGIRRVIKAASAQRPNNNSPWILQQVREYRLLSDKVAIQKTEQQAAPDLLPNTILSMATVTPEQLSAQELAAFIENQRENALSSEYFELEYWKHFTTPLSTLVMLILAAPLVFGFQRNAGAGQRIFIGILIGISYLLLDRIISRTGLVYGLAPFWSAVLPLLLFTAVGLFFLRRIR